VSAALAPRPATADRSDALEQIAAGLEGMARGIRLYGEILDRQGRNASPAVQCLTIEEAAARLACSPDHVRQRCRAGLIKAMRDGRLWRVTESDLEAYRRRRTR